MKTRSIGYWAVTSLVALAFAAGGLDELHFFHLAAFGCGFDGKLGQRAGALNKGAARSVEWQVGIGEQFNAAHTLPYEGLEPFGIPGPKEPTNRNQMLRGEMRLFVVGDRQFAFDVSSPSLDYRAQQDATVTLREPSCWHDDATDLVARVSGVGTIATADNYRLERSGSF